MNQARQITTQAFPTFLPDGRHFLYFQSSFRSEYRGIYIGSLDSKPGEQSTKRFLATSYGHVYIPPQSFGPGQILFMRDQTLMSQGFDDKRLELIGEPFPVAEHIGFYSLSGYFSASTNGILVYRSGGAGQITSAKWFDRQGKELATAGEEGAYTGLSLSPDGARAAVSTNLNLWLLDFAKGTKAHFTFGHGENTNPVWSPNGSHIIFSSYYDGAYNLYQKNRAVLVEKSYC
jgi:WD40 repeat protein